MKKKNKQQPKKTQKNFLKKKTSKPPAHAQRNADHL